MTFGFLGRWWRKRRRAHDLAFVWPACKVHALTISDARDAFRIYCGRVYAWTVDLSDEQIEAVCSGLR